MILSDLKPSEHINSIMFRLKLLNPDISTVEAQALQYIFSASAMTGKVLTKLQDFDKALKYMLEAVIELDDTDIEYGLHVNAATSVMNHHGFAVDMYNSFVQQYKLRDFKGDIPELEDFAAHDFVERFADYLKELIFIICAPIVDKMVDQEAEYMCQCDDIKYAMEIAGPNDDLNMLEIFDHEIQLLRDCYLESEASFIVNLEYVSSILEEFVSAII